MGVLCDVRVERRGEERNDIINIFPVCITVYVWLAGTDIPVQTGQPEYLGREANYKQTFSVKIFMVEKYFEM